MRKLFTPATALDGTVLPYAYGWYVQQYQGETLVWHSGWDEEAGFSALYLKVPRRKLTLILLGNGEGLWWDNPLDGAAPVTLRCGKIDLVSHSIPPRHIRMRSHVVQERYRR